MLLCRHYVILTGSDIEVDLIKMLEARLDEHVLVEIETLLSRNPNCMLTPQDVNVSDCPFPIESIC